MPNLPPMWGNITHCARTVQELPFCTRSSAPCGHCVGVSFYLSECLDLGGTVTFVYAMVALGSDLLLLTVGGVVSNTARSDE